jgi:hypothetical protein
MRKLASLELASISFVRRVVRYKLETYLFRHAAGANINAHQQVAVARSLSSPHQFW